jgi:hypothetical protein
VDAGTYIESNIRLASTSDYNALQKISELQSGDKFLFYLLVVYIYSTNILVEPTDKMPLLAYLPPSERHEQDFEVTTHSA